MTASPSALPEQIAGTPPTGSFCWNVVSDRWDWSPEVYLLHGYRPGEIDPTTAVTLNHKHPDDLERYVEDFHAGIVAGEPIVHEHRLVDIHGRTRPVVVLARANPDHGEVDTVRGYFLPIDTDQWVLTSAQNELERLAAVAMLAFGLSEPGARAVLDWYRERADGEAALVPPELPAAATVGDLTGLRRTLVEQMFPAEFFRD